MTGPESRSKHFKAITELADTLKDKLGAGNALRLLLLYSLRYENDDKVHQLKQELKSRVPLSDELLKTMDCLLQYAGKARRKGELFRE